MCCEEIIFRLGSLKMVSVDSETRRSRNYDVIYFTLYGAQEVLLSSRISVFKKINN